VWQIFEVCHMRRFSSLLKHDEISDSEGSAVMRLGMVLLGVAVILNVAVPQVASSQMKSRPGDTTPGGAPDAASAVIDGA